MTTREKRLLGALAAAVAVWWLLRRDEAAVWTCKRYTPNSDKARELFRFAAITADLPPEWGDDPGLHYILQRESGGWVGRPNYLYNHLFGKGFSYPGRCAEWPHAWAIERLDEKLSQAKARHPKFVSRATGLGQLQPGNAKKFYPNGLAGVGDPVNEAIGMLRYIASRYGSPAVARSVYGEKAHYTHAITGKKLYKGFKEGY